MNKISGRNKLGGKFFTLLGLLFLLVLAVSGCQTPTEYRLEADKMGQDIIQQKSSEALGRAMRIDIERPSNIFRRRLLSEQDLIYSNEASLGTDQLTPIEHWPETNYPSAIEALDPIVLIEPNEPVRLTLLQALQIGARNSFDYQEKKEEIFKKALALDLERNEFRNTFVSQVETLLSTDSTGDRTVSGTVTSGSVGLSRKLESGTELTTALAIDLANVTTLGGFSIFGISGDASISMPLLRGSGKHIVMEPLTQAEREVVYAIYEFERFKRTFAVDVASDYLSVLNQLDGIKNSESNYKSLISSTRRSRRLAEAGEMGSIEVGQSVQNELNARERWIRARESYKKGLDSFKGLLGLPPDARIELDRYELEKLAEPTKIIMEEIDKQEQMEQVGEVLPADAPIELIEPSREGAGPYEIESSVAMRLALDNRLDLRTATGRVYDAQRDVVIAADQLGAELTLLGSASSGGSRSLSSTDQDDAQFRFDKAKYSALLTLDLPFERTQERNNYRNSFIELERSTRDVQVLEDKIKLAVINELRDLMQTRESLYIQAKAVYVAEKRVKSVALFLEAGRAQMRDLLEAQEALLSAQNSLTRAVVDYRVAELQLQRDTGLLKVDEKGLWQEFNPEEIENVSG
ncbi:MAG: TolC family protein [Phycisphaerales bacterium]